MASPSTAKSLSGPTVATETSRREIQLLDACLEKSFSEKLGLEKVLTRQLVSNQANKNRAVCRWFKYKEAFSAALVEYLLWSDNVIGGRLLDPFAGAGTALFAGAELGLDTVGIELLPIGREIVRTRMLVSSAFEARDIARLVRWHDERPWLGIENPGRISALRITNGAYPSETEKGICSFLAALESEDAAVKQALRLALLSVLEDVSYTRKDGQYLRWDARAGRRQGARPFSKGHIPKFDAAICDKLSQIVVDLQDEQAPLELFSKPPRIGEVRLLDGSCLDLLPSLGTGSFDLIFTSPPYCNRYDYTRTYALELALLGVNEKEIVRLRQAMLSCTVENRAKDLVALNPAWKEAVMEADRCELLQAILRYLTRLADRNELNNTGIPRMVKGYFYEMACVIYECARVLRSDGTLYMVNDNVRYAGAPISVDLILSSLAERLGFQVRRIMVLPNGKGNSSQQMGEHGRTPLRKCVYVWRRR